MMGSTAEAGCSYWGQAMPVRMTPAARSPRLAAVVCAAEVKQGSRPYGKRGKALLQNVSVSRDEPDPLLEQIARDLNPVEVRPLRLPNRAWTPHPQRTYMHDAWVRAR